MNGLNKPTFGGHHGGDGFSTQAYLLAPRPLSFLPPGAASRPPSFHHIRPMPLFLPATTAAYTLCRGTDVWKSRLHTKPHAPRPLRKRARCARGTCRAVCQSVPLLVRGVGQRGTLRGWRINGTGVVRASLRRAPHTRRMELPLCRFILTAVRGTRRSVSRWPLSLTDANRRTGRTSRIPRNAAYERQPSAVEPDGLGAW